jgi:hypothetical protein
VETRRAPATAQKTACRPRASQMRLIVMRPSPLLGRKCRREPRSTRSPAPCADQLASQVPGRLDSLKTRV